MYIMRVKKRDGSYEDVSFDKVIRRIKNHSNDLKKFRSNWYSTICMCSYL